MKIITISGNKPYELNIRNEKDPRIPFIKAAIKQRLVSLAEEGLEWVITTGQMGVELWAAEVIVDLKQEYPIKLGIFPPFLEYESRWPEIYQQKYLEITEQADHFQPLYNETYQAPYQLMNKDYWLIDKSEGGVLLVDEDFPGTVQYLLEKMKEAVEQEQYQLMFITPEDLEDIVREQQLDA
ncbi:SLOG family protein [Gracilibacillus alcaliphilus]|uniref:SLOG family protein n=1 Tax=Gracilibacillus alcaliphilus TaxID=1401441 RepID=UPI0019596905|nr:SLOG family protein [Gracilibacillus alcaliphilus]MBM7675229.1 putative phage-like protein YoqJ [Gracilibacillus alcaliphilus]